MVEYYITDDLAACLALRRQVFIDEQSVPEAEEVDGKDDTAIHILASENGRPLGTARLLIAGDMAKIGRVCVLADARGRGVGAGLMRFALAYLAERGDVARARLGAQTHALDFYRRLGFAVCGPEYLDAGIPHRDMQAAIGGHHATD